MVSTAAPGRKQMPAGHDSVRTLGTVTVQRGGSVTIPCLYDQEYKHHVKYWCRGGIWSSCSTVVRTDSPQRRGEVSITDQPNQLLFNVTIRNLQEKDSGLYWCAVEIGGLGTVDDSVSLYLSVTTGVPGVKTESWVSAERGGFVTIPCHYDQKYKHHNRGVVRTDSPQSEGEVSITDDPDQLLFTVTIRNLQEKDSDLYWFTLQGVSTQVLSTPLSEKLSVALIASPVVSCLGGTGV
ncbi:polymeric immunoglobulin receptor-like [Arapaima gigas]